MFDNIRKWSEDNGYVLLEKIPANWDRYGDGCPSVTTILSLLYDSWFEYVKRNHAQAVKDACDRWTKVHGDAEDFFNGWDPVIHSQIMKFHILYDVEIIDQELNARKGWMQWTIDLVWKVRWKLCNVDYKSSPKQSRKYFLQLWGYEYLNGLPGYVLYLSEKKMELVEMPEGYEELFVELKDYFFYLKNDGKIA